MIKSIEYIGGKIIAVVFINDAFVTVELSEEETKGFYKLIIDSAKEKLEKREGHYSFNKTNGNLDFN